jgi:hypothetical protein
MELVLVCKGSLVFGMFAVVTALVFNAMDENVSRLMAVGPVVLV